MIEKEDITELSKIADVDWLVKDHIDEIELANISKDYDYLLINYDIVENLSEEFYKIIANTRLKAISTDIAGMDLAKPKVAKESGIYLLNTSNYCTESVAEYSIAQIFLYAKQIHSAYIDYQDNSEMLSRKMTKY